MHVGDMIHAISAPATLLVLSDTHIGRDGQGLGDSITMHFSKVDAIIHAGDYTSPGILDELEATGKFIGVHGNMDGEGIRSRLPPMAELNVGGVGVGIIHGWGGPEGIVQRVHPACKERGFDMVIVGHTHRRLEEEYMGIKYFNPGSPTDRVHARENTLLLLTIHSKDRVHAQFVKTR